MGIVFVVLTILSGIALIIGFVWMLSSKGKTTRRSGPEVGAEIMGGSASDEDEGVGMTLLDRSVFAGRGVSVTREASFSFAEVKQLLREGNRKAALPLLLAGGGLFCFVVFGVFALWIALDDKLVATLIAVVALFTMARIARDFVRA